MDAATSAHEILSTLLATLTSIRFRLGGVRKRRRKSLRTR